MYYKEERRYFLGYTLFSVLDARYLQPDSVWDMVTLGTTQVLVQYDPHVEAQDPHRTVPVQLVGTSKKTSVQSETVWKPP